jgi:hypothetical protein
MRTVTFLLRSSGRLVDVAARSTRRIVRPHEDERLQRDKELSRLLDLKYQNALALALGALPQVDVIPAQIASL